MKTFKNIYPQICGSENTTALLNAGLLLVAQEA